MCGSEGNGAHAVEHSKCAGGDVWLQDGHGVGVHGEYSNALLVISKNSHKDIMQLVLEKGAHVNAGNWSMAMPCRLHQIRVTRQSCDCSLRRELMSMCREDSMATPC